MSELRLENSIVDDLYYVERCLGRGSYAEVFLAFDQQRNDEPVIIKALNTSLQGTPDAELERTLVENFQNEAIALDRVRHPNIIRRLGHGTASDLDGVAFHYLVLEYMPGGDLLKLCSKRPFDLDQSLSYFQQVAQALAYAHSCQVIHRDIKPNNLLLSADQRILKIADFGVAKMSLDDSCEITRVGTHVYAPPEHHPECDSDVAGQRLTPSADVYSLAKTIYTAMTGRAPRQFARHPIAELPSEMAAQPWGPRLTAILRKATASQVEDRYQSIQELWDDFSRLRLGATDEVRLDDDEATIVRRRLNTASSASPAAAQPEFRALAAATTGTFGPRARIVVELPQKLEPHRVEDVEVEPTGPEQNAAPNVIATDRRSVSTKVLGSDAPAEKGAANASQNAPRRLSTYRIGFRAEWLRWAFTLCLVVALAGIVASTYYHFAGGEGVTGLIGNLKAKEGLITGALNVNLRSEPGGSILVVLPAGTRVRVLEEKGNWIRVKVTGMPNSQPDPNVDTGWVGSQFVKTD